MVVRHGTMMLSQEEEERERQTTFKPSFHLKCNSKQKMYEPLCRTIDLERIEQEFWFIVYCAGIIVFFVCCDVSVRRRHRWKTIGGNISTLAQRENLTLKNRKQDVNAEPRRT